MPVFPQWNIYGGRLRMPPRNKTLTMDGFVIDPGGISFPFSFFRMMVVLLNKKALEGN
jgi:hypothetical protein